MSETQNKPEAWRVLAEFIEAGDGEGLTRFLAGLPPSELARALSRLSDDDQTSLMTLLDPRDAADLIQELHEAQGTGLLEDLPAERVAAILNNMESDLRVDLLSAFEESEQEAFLQAMTPEKAQDARALLVYSPNTAGGLMITEYLSYNDKLRVQDVLNDLREHAEKYSDYGVQYVYITSEDGKLVGVIRLRDLVLSPGSTPLAKIMIPDPACVRVDSVLEDLEQFFDRHAYFGVPVIDNFGRLVGVVHRDDVEEAQGEVAAKAFQRFAGIVGGDELRSMPLSLRAFRRLSFLSVNIFLNVIAASVIALYESTLQAVIALAVFLPIISDMSGCSGNQSVAVSIRELSLGLIKPKDFFRVWFKEAQVGLLNGVALGALIGLVAYFWKGMPYLALVVGCALCLNTLIAVTMGGVIPLVLKRVKMDPALAAAPLLTTVTDMCGFLLSLSFATFALNAGKL